MTAASDGVEELFANRMRQRREQLGISTRAFAEKMREQGFDWHHTTVQRTEQAKRPIRLAEASSVAALLETDLGYLIAPISEPVEEVPEIRPEMLAQAEEEYEQLRAQLAEARAEERAAAIRLQQAQETAHMASQEHSVARAVMDSASARMGQLERHLAEQTKLVTIIRNSLQEAASE